MVWAMVWQFPIAGEDSVLRCVLLEGRVPYVSNGLCAAYPRSELLRAESSWGKKTWIHAVAAAVLNGVCVQVYNDYCGC